MYLHIWEVCQAVGSFPSSAVCLYVKRHRGTGCSSVFQCFWSSQFILPCLLSPWVLRSTANFHCQDCFCRKKSTLHSPIIKWMQVWPLTPSFFQNYKFCSSSVSETLQCLLISAAAVAVVWGNQRLAKAEEACYPVDVSQHLDYWLRK